MSCPKPDGQNLPAIWLRGYAQRRDSGYNYPEINVRNALLGGQVMKDSININEDIDPQMRNIMHSGDFGLIHDHAQKLLDSNIFELNTPEYNVLKDFVEATERLDSQMINRNSSSLAMSFQNNISPVFGN